MSPGPRSRGTRADHHGDHTNGADGSKEATEKGLPPGLHVRSLWSDDECRSIERDIDGIKVLANAGQLKSATVDRTPFRSKYFFGYGYTYGAQVSGKGAEQLLPPEFVDPIPEWVHSKLISRLEEEEIVPRGWINSAVVNDYLPGGMIVSHIDPKQLFARPICIATFFAEGRLAFGVQFVFADRRFSSEKSSRPKFIASMPRGSLTLMDGYSADGITHGIRPEDFDSRRVSVVLRHVFTDAPTVHDPGTILKPAQRGAPVTAAKRIGTASMVNDVVTRTHREPPHGNAASREGKRRTEHDDDYGLRPSKSRRVAHEEAVDSSRNRSQIEEDAMLRRIKGTYLDDRSGATYSVAADGTVQVLFAPKSGSSGPASATWKVEPSGDGSLLCGGGILLPSGIHSDRLIWARRDSTGPNLVWLRASEADSPSRAGSSAEDSRQTRLPTPGGEPLEDSRLQRRSGHPQVRESSSGAALNGTTSKDPVMEEPPAIMEADSLDFVNLNANPLCDGTGLPLASMALLQGGALGIGSTGGGCNGTNGTSVFGGLMDLASTGQLPMLPGGPSLNALLSSMMSFPGMGLPGANPNLSPLGNPLVGGCLPSMINLAGGMTGGSFGSGQISGTIPTAMQGAMSSAGGGNLLNTCRTPPPPPSPVRRVTTHQAMLETPKQLRGRTAPYVALMRVPGVAEEVKQVERNWFYKDAEGVVQGPFTSSVMSGWSQQGFFPEDTLVRAEEEEDFSELGNGMKLLLS